MRASDPIVVTDSSRPISTWVLTLPGGSLLDPPGKEGLAYLTGQMLLRGTERFSQAELTDELDFLGSSLSVGVGRRRTNISGDSLTRNFDAFVALVSEAISKPTFPADELDKLKRITLAEIAQVRDNDSALGQRFFVHELFEGHPYGRSLKGNPNSLARIGIDDVRDFYQQHYRGGGNVIAASGDVTSQRLRAYIDATLGSLPEGATSPPAITAPKTRAGNAVVLVDKPERTQTQVYIGHVTLNALHPDYLPLTVAQTIFGGTFTARLSREIREKRGWSYGAYSYLACDQNLGTFTIRFYPAIADTLPALQLADQLFEELVDKGVSATEVDFAKAYLANSHPFSIDTAERRMSELLNARLTGYPPGWVDTYPERLAHVDSDAVNAAIREHLSPGGVVTTVVATASDLEAGLREWSRASSIEVVPYDTELD